MSEDARAKLHAELEKADDWEGQCQRCGLKFRGSLRLVRLHQEECPEREKAK